MDMSGIYTIDVFVNDSYGGFAEASFQLIVTNTNPEIDINTIPSDISVNEGIEISHVVGLSFITTTISNDYIWSIRMEDSLGNSIPDGSYIDNVLNITRLDVSRARITGTPGWDMSGDYTMFVDVSDGHGGWTEYSFDFTVTIPIQ